MMEAKTEENTAVGILKITFAADITKQELLEKFSEFMVLTGTINLSNGREEEVNLDIHDIEYLGFDEDSDY